MSSDARPNRVKFRPVPRSITPHHAQLLCSELSHRNAADVRWWLLVRQFMQIVHTVFGFEGLPFCLTRNIFTLL
jgi:hypothetical protein